MENNKTYEYRNTLKNVALYKQNKSKEGNMVFKQFSFNANKDYLLVTIMSTTKNKQASNGKTVGQFFGSDRKPLESTNVVNFGFTIQDELPKIMEMLNDPNLKAKIPLDNNEKKKFSFLHKTSSKTKAADIVKNEYGYTFVLQDFTENKNEYMSLSSGEIWMFKSYLEEAVKVWFHTIPTNNPQNTEQNSNSNATQASNQVEAEVNDNASDNEEESELPF